LRGSPRRAAGLRKRLRSVCLSTGCRSGGQRA